MLHTALHPAFVLPKAEICVRNHVQPYISSILEALMTPTSQGFAEVREVFFKEVTDMNMNIVNEGGMEKLVEVSSEPGRLEVGSGMANPITIPSRDIWEDTWGWSPCGGVGCGVARPSPAELSSVPSTWRSCPTWPSTR